MLIKFMNMIKTRFIWNFYLYYKLQVSKTKKKMNSKLANVRQYMLFIWMKKQFSRWIWWNYTKYNVVHIKKSKLKCLNFSIELCSIFVLYNICKINRLTNLIIKIAKRCSSFNWIQLKLNRIDRNKQVGKLKALELSKYINHILVEAIVLKMFFIIS